MRALATLVRLRREALDERRQRVSELENRLDALDRRRRDLDEDNAKEQRLIGSSTEMLFAYPGYAAWVRVERQRLADARAAVETQATAAREELVVAFSELKKLEIAEAEQRRRRHKEQARLEQKRLDEVGLIQHRRRA